MGDAKMTAEERVSEHEVILSGCAVVYCSSAVEIAQAHAAAALAEADKRIKALEEERDSLRERVRVRHREDQEWVTKQLAQVYPWWQKACQEREVARQDALAARRERDEHRGRVAELEAALTEFEEVVHIRIPAGYDQNVADALVARGKELEAKIKRLRDAPPDAQVFAQYDCGHPHCRRCKATRVITAARAAESVPHYMIDDDLGDGLMGG